MKKLMGIFLATAMICSLTACGSSGGTAPVSTTPAQAPAASGESIDVSVQFSFPETQARSTQAILDKISEESGGRLNFETYYSFSLFGATDVIGALQDGSLDIAGFMTSEYPGLFPLNGTLVGLPFLGYPNETVATEIYRDMVKTNDAMRQEMEKTGIMYYSSWVLPSYQLNLMGDKAVTTPEFSGLTLMTENSYMQKMINKYGGAAMLSFPPEFYSNLNNGVADGIVSHMNVLDAFGCLELIKNATFFGEGGIYMYPLCYGISPDFWNSLPADIQEIFLKYADELSDAGLEYDIQMLADNVASLESKANVVHLTEAEIEVWKEAFADIHTSAIADLSAANPAAEDVYNELVSRINNYR